MALRSRTGSERARGLASACAALVLLLAASPSRGGEVVEYYHLDAVGNVRAVTNEAGQVVERHDYLPFGEEWCQTAVCGSPTPGQPLRFTGKERDAETGLDYFGARYYGSGIGRFTTVDPVFTWQENLVDPQRWNRYAYARNNPLRYVDPDGRTAWDTLSGWFNAVSSNFFLGGGRMQPYHPDYAAGQAAGDRFSLALGLFETGIGFGGGAVLEIPSLGTVTIPAAAIVTHGLGVSATAGIHLSKNQGGSTASTLSPGPYAGESIPARGPQRDFKPGERGDINQIGATEGCHTCGTTTPGTKTGNFVPDHQPPTAVNRTNAPQRLYPQCIGCSRKQGGEVTATVRKEGE